MMNTRNVRESTSAPRRIESSTGRSRRWREKPLSTIVRDVKSRRKNKTLMPTDAPNRKSQRRKRSLVRAERLSFANSTVRSTKAILQHLNQSSLSIRSQRSLSLPSLMILMPPVTIRSLPA